MNAFIAFLLTVPVISTSQLEPVKLAMRIVDGVRSHAGLETTAGRPPVVSGPFVVDSLSFAANFDWAFGTPAGTEVGAALRSRGYGFATLPQVTQTDSTSGVIKHSLVGDALLVRLVYLIRNGTQATALVRYYYTYNNQVCPRTLRLRFTFGGDTWITSGNELIGRC